MARTIAYESGKPQTKPFSEVPPLEMPPVASVLINWMHLSAAMVWLGAIFTGSAVLLRRTHGKSPPITDRVSAAFYRVFSPYAWVALAVLAVTGTVKASQHLEEGWPDLFATPWGQLLVAKLIVALLMVSGGAYATYIIAPRLGRRSTTAADARMSAALERRLHLIGVVTALLGLGLLLIVTLL